MLSPWVMQGFVGPFRQPALLRGGDLADSRYL